MNKRILGVNILLFAYFLVLNFFQPLVSDDLCRGAAAALWNHTIWEHLVSDYMNWTGRMTAQLLAYVFLNAPLEGYLIPLFNVVNSFALAVFIFKTFRISTINSPKLSASPRFYVFYAAVMLLVLYATRFLASALWKTGGLQYLWGLSILVSVAYSLLRARSESNGKAVLFFAVGLFIGNYNEIYFSSILIVAFAYALYAMLSGTARNALSNSLYSFLFGDLIGGCVLIAAPGNYVRLGTVAHGGVSFWEKTVMLGRNISHNQYLIYLFVVFVLFCVLSLRCCGGERKKTQLAAAIGAATLVLLYVQLLPIAHYDFDNRMFMFWTTVAIVLIFSTCVQTCRIEAFFTRYENAVLCVSIGLIVPFVLSTVHNYHDESVYSAKNMEIINAARERGAETVILPGRGERDAMFRHGYFGGLSQDKNFWANKCAASYFGVGAIAIADDDRR